ncbi:adenine phosphoribosyltransferase [Pseudarthrobacter sp. MM222]|uniref:adenine phosphoribosyltransferase n=1 Tax=Pseudarthrobacter sp. MM222 TaxID=3018929 RepID=UPI00221F275F|nr:adenine phosphoribosyltransferase [Pseudarthrobacter sp. MM222]CAI3795894.1 Adenine phosphoribosyltransferase [Pseudarthrobacter sp. MM222]
MNQRQQDPNQTTNATPVDELISSLCATIPDYPKPGINFKDLTPVFADGAAFKAVVEALVAPFRGQFDAVAGVEARGFLLAAAAAYATGTGVVTVRKAGKLPREVVSEDYALEYGKATLELHTTDLAPGSRVLILDDVLATGGTLGAAVGLFERCGIQVAGVGVVLELEDLPGRAALAGLQVRSLLRV